jgi:hypothetical protein
MRRLTYVLIAGAVALSLTAFTIKLLAGPGCDAKAAGKSCPMASASASGGKSCAMASAGAAGGKSCPMASAGAAGGKSCAMGSGGAAGAMCVTGHVMGSACAARSALSSLVKEAPGTKAELVNVDNGVSLIVSTADAGRVATVQSVMAREIDSRRNMKPGATGACAHGGTVEGAAGATHACAAMKGAEGATTEKAGMKCCAGKGAGSTCPEWMCTLGCARFETTNTAGGVTLTWTTDKPENLDALRKAGQNLQAEIAKL